MHAHARGASRLDARGAHMMASVGFDFGYRLERAISPDKRGPADPEVDWSSSGMSALDAMCNPGPPSQLDFADAASAATEATNAAEAVGNAMAKAATAAGTVAAAATVVPDSASSCEPIIALVSMYVG